MTNKQIWDYSPAPESTDHIQLKDQYDLFINGEFIPAVDRKYFDTINPSNERKIAEVAEAGKADIEKGCGFCAKSLIKKHGTKNAYLKNEEKYIYRNCSITAGKSKRILGH